MSIPLSLSGGDAVDERDQPGPRSGATDATGGKKTSLRAIPDFEGSASKSGSDVAQGVVSRHLDHYTSGRSLPPLIAGFLYGHWRSYMVQLYLREGDRGKAWSAALENTGLLRWSVEPKSDDESRRRLYALLPGLFQWVHAILKSQQVAVADEDAFFAELARIHASALHPEQGDGGESVPAGDRDSRPQDPPLGAHGDGGDGAGEPAGAAPRLPANPRTACRSAPADADADLLRDLVIGAWVELQRERATKRVLRLEWISKEGGVYLFRDGKRGDSLCLTAARCVQLLREGAATILK